MEYLKYTAVTPYGRQQFHALKDAKKHAQSQSARAYREKQAWDNRDSIVYAHVSPAHADGLVAVAAYNEGRVINPDRY